VGVPFPGLQIDARSVALQVLFFVSGAAGLTYETVWGRWLHTVFGTSQFAIATVLAAFMAGLAAGGAVAARLAPAIRHPLRVYAALEVVVGLYALAFPSLLGMVEPVYLALGGSLGPVAFGVVQFVLVGALLLVPCACMGASLPVLLRLDLPGGRGRVIGSLYALNTAGALFGTWLAGFWLLPVAGVSATNVLAALADFALAAVAWRMGGAAGPLEPTRQVPDARWLVVAALAGCASLAAEVAWFRLMTLILGGSVYAFTVMLLAFLAGIALGGRLAGPWADRLGPGVARAVGLTQLAVALLTWTASWLWGLLPLAFVKAYIVIEPMAYTLLWPTKCVLAGLVMGGPALLMGASFPLLATAAGGRARDVGAIYAANTVGGLVGAFCAGFWWLPTLHLSGTVALVVGLGLIAAAVAWPGALRIGVPAAVLVALVRVPWDPMWMTTGVYKYVDNLTEGTADEIRRKMIDRYDLLFYDEGLSSVVTVARNRVTGNVWLANNGKIDASSTTDMPTQTLVAHLPFLFTDAPRDAMVIGLASGITLGSVTLHPEPARIDVVEIEPAIREASEFFSRWNHRPFDDPRVHLVANDGRNQLLRTPERSLDLVVAEPSNPWLTGVSNLFTREFFAMGRSRLRSGGVWSQWVQMYGMDGRDLRAVMRTFCDVFPYVVFFSTIRDADLVMVGSDAPLEVTAARAGALVRKNVGIEAEMLGIGVEDGYDLLAHYLFDREVALSLTADVPLNTDDNLLVEFSAPHHLHRETSAENFLMLLPRATTPTQAVPTVDGLIRLAAAYDARDDEVRALVALKQAEEREPGRSDVLAYYNMYQRKLRRRLR
jgi:spermidine synthase